MRTNPFFIVGAQRSGTTLLRLMLNRHPRLSVPYESVFIPDLQTQAGATGILTADEATAILSMIADHPFVIRGGLLPDPAAVLALRPRTYQDLVDAMFRELARRRGKCRWGDKTPSYVSRMPTIRALFPDAQFIHLIRDGRGVAASMRRLRWWGEHNILTCAARWSSRVWSGRTFGSTLTADYLEVRYEDLVRSPRAVLGRTCDFLGEEFDPVMLDHHESARSDMPAAAIPWHDASTSPVDPSKAEAWTRLLSPDDVALFESAAGATLAAFDYPLHNPSWTASTCARWCWARMKQAWSSCIPDVSRPKGAEG